MIRTKGWKKLGLNKKFDVFVCQIFFDLKRIFFVFDVRMVRTMTLTMKLMYLL